MLLRPDAGHHACLLSVVTRMKVLTDLPWHLIDGATHLQTVSLHDTDILQTHTDTVRRIGKIYAW